MYLIECLPVGLKVVPLSQRSGILEWCEGTVPIGEYLIGVNGAHQRYKPNDWKAVDCRKAMSVRQDHFIVFVLVSIEVSRIVDILSPLLFQYQ